MPSEPEARPWNAIVLSLLAVLGLGVLTLVFLGSQVSGILSTVGSSVPAHPVAGGGSTPGEPGGGSGTGGGEGEGEQPGGGDGGPDVPLLGIDRPELLVIKTGEIVIQVDDVDAALGAATGTIDGLGGYVSGSSRTGAGLEATASITFRIPAAAWDRALTSLRELGGEVLDERTTSDDVTGRVVDIEARIRNLRVTEAALQSIMARATLIEDVLTVQEELTDVRGEIEELQSQAAHLREQAAMSTLTLQVRRTPAPVVEQQEGRFDPGAEADAATAHLVSIGQAMTKVGIWFGIVWLPILVGLAVVGGIALFAYRRFRPEAPLEADGAA